MTRLRQGFGGQARPTPTSLLTGASLLLIGLAILWAVGVHLCSSVVAPPSIVAHRITTDCYTPAEIARAYGWTGDWRDYMTLVEQINGWPAWPILNRGDDVLVLDYRPAGKERADRRGAWTCAHQNRIRFCGRAGGGAIAAAGVNPTLSSSPAGRAVLSQSAPHRRPGRGMYSRPFGWVTDGPNRSGPPAAAAHSGRSVPGRPLSYPRSSVSIRGCRRSPVVT